MVSSQAFSQPVDMFGGTSKKTARLKTGITMKYVESGTKRGTPLILLHGFTDTSRSFQLLINELNKLDSNLRIIAPDLRGHGDSSMPMESFCADQPGRCFTFEKFAEDIIDLMDQLEIPKAHIVGHSMGSIVLQVLALNYPERVNSITLISTIAYTEHNVMIQDVLIRDMMENTWKKILIEQRDFRWPSDAYLKKPHDLGEDVKNFLRDNWVTEACSDQRFLDSVYPETVSIPIGTWIGSLTALSEVDTRDALKNLEVPTLVLWASQDVMFDEHDQELVKAALETPAAKGKVKIIHKTYGKQGVPDEGYPLAEIGHNLHWAAPAQVAEDIISFLRSGLPVVNRPYANPDNMKEIKVEQTDVGVDVL